MMIFADQRLPSSSARVRATMSTAPPGGNGTRRCTGFEGKLSWARVAELGATHERIASAMIAAQRPIETAIAFSRHSDPVPCRRIEGQAVSHGQAKPRGCALRQM